LPRIQRHLHALASRIAARCGCFLPGACLAAGALLAAGPGPAAGATDAGAREASAGYEREVAALDAEHGALAPQLVEPLAALGAAYLAEQRPADAVAVLRRALHIRRANEGLHRIRHAGLVEMLIEANTALGDAVAVERNYELLYWLHRRHHGDESPALLPVIERAARWRIERFLHSESPRRYQWLLGAESLYIDATRILEAQPGGKAGALARSHYQRAVINAHLYEASERLGADVAAMRKALHAHGRTTFQVRPDLLREEIKQDAYLRGRRNARRAVELAERAREAAPGRYAHALVFLGDWYLATGRERNAKRQYRAAWAVLQEAAPGAPAGQALFHEPVPVSPLRAPGAPALAPDPRARRVEAVLDVQPTGWPDNIRILRAHPPNEPGLARRGRRAIAGLRYRPRFENGEPVAARNVHLTYVFRAQEQAGLLEFFSNSGQ